VEPESQNLEPGTENIEPATRNPRPVALDLAALRAAPRALQRLALWRAIERAGGTRRVGAVHIDAALALVDAAHGACVDVPGIRVHRIGPRIVLTKRSASGSHSVNHWRFPLSIPGEVTTGRVTLSAELVDPGAARLTGIDLGADVGNGHVAAVRADLLRLGPQPGLAVRNRRPGDSFRPVGLGGRKKLQDAFVDRKIVRGERDSVPIVVDDSDRIVWVAGHGIDEAFRVTDASQSVVVLKLRYLERCS
jgi:tRNA(Ile)-lysidine synthase